MESYWISAVLVVTGLFFVALGFRARTTNQWRTSLDAYAEREIARQRRKQTLRRTQALFTLFRSPADRHSPASFEEVLSEETV
ncbi:MAG TPA: hypothetical protein VL371_22440 [Gemmataceae bacterium]|jgi:hypothetical protein|nr:hypothetical protein [Gemmataceae bacterium]